MNDATSTSASQLCAAIHAAAIAQADKLRAASAAQGDKLLADATAQAAILRQQRQAQTATESARRRDRALATVPVAAGRHRQQRLETVLASIHDAAVAQLATVTPATQRASVIALAAAAIRGMPGDTWMVRLSPADLTRLGPTLASDIAAAGGCPAAQLTVVADTSLHDGALWVQDPAGRRVWDQSPAARLARLWPEWRRQLATQTGLVPAAPPGGGGA